MIARPIIVLTGLLYLPWLLILNCPARNDALRATLPWWTFTRRELFAGRLPLWDPARLAGIPHLANIQAGVFYPPNWLLLPFPVHLAIGLSLVLHIGLAGILLAAFARSLAVESTVASLAGMAYVAGAFATSRVYAGHVAVLQGMTWAPLMLLASRHLVITGSRRWAGILGVGFWLSILAGYPAVAACSLMTAVAVFVMSLGDGCRPWRSAQLALLGLSLAVLAAAPALWSVAELVSQSTRAGGLSAQAAQGSMRLLDLPLLIWPWFFGAEPLGSFWSGGLLFWHELQSAGGIAVAGLAALGFTARKNERVVRGVAALTLLSLVLALGTLAPVAGFLQYLAPSLQAFRVPARFLIVWTVLVPVLAAMGFQALLAEPSATRRSRFFRLCIGACSTALLLELGMAAIAVVRVSGAVSRLSGLQMLVGSLLGIANVSTSAVGLIILQLVIERQSNGPRPLQHRVGSMRCAVLGELIIVAIVNIYSPFRFSLATAVNDLGAVNIEAISTSRSRVAFHWVYAQYSNLGDIFGFNSATTYDPLLLGRTVSLLRSGQSIDDPWRDASNNVLLDRDGGAAFDILGVGHFLQAGPHGAELRTRTTYLQRISVIKNARFVKTAQESLAAVVSPTFDPRAEVVLESPPVGLTTTQTPASASESVDILREQPGLLEASVNAPGGGYLVLSESYYPGWQAEANGQIARLVPADHAIMAAHLAPGSYRITFRFTAPWLWPSLALSCTGAAGIVFLLWKDGPLQPNARPDSSPLTTSHATT